METYFPFLATHWQTVGLIGASLATGILVGRIHQSQPRTDRNPQVHHNSVIDNNLITSKKRKVYSEMDEETVENDQRPTPEEEAQHILYKYTRLSESECIRRSDEFYHRMNQRRSLRSFSSDPVPLEVIENIVRTGGIFRRRVLLSKFSTYLIVIFLGTSPSGAHTEPWTFVVIGNQDIKYQIRQIIEEEEEINYKQRMGVLKLLCNLYMKS